MKLITIITVAAITVNCYHATAQNKPVKNNVNSKQKTAHQKENAFGVSVFKVLQDRNIDAWIALYPTNDEYRDILQAGLAAKAEGLTQQLIDEMLVRRKKEATAAYTAQFNHYCKLADSLTINWKNAVFQKFDFSPVYPEPVKLKYLDGVIWFKVKDQHFVIDGIQAVEIPSGYKLQALTDVRQVDDGE
jgi:hypothetical protein